MRRPIVWSMRPRSGSALAPTARLAQRREAWRAFAEALGTVSVCADLDAPDVTDALRALPLAMRSPVARAGP